MGDPVGVLIPGPAQETFSGIAVDSTGGIWMAGYFEDRFDVGLGPVTGAGASNWALWRFVED